MSRHPLPHQASRISVYEVNTRQYTDEGTFEAFGRHLPRLADMGVDILWFMPVTPISLEGRKGSLGSYYAASDHRSVNPEFGQLSDLQAVVAEAHRLGMRVIIDWVANHTGCDHHWTKSRPHFYKRNEQGAFYDAHGWDDVIDLDYGNADLRREMIASMRWWIDQCGIDGFRCDMAMLTPADFWAEARAALDPIKPLFWLAELDPLENPEHMQVFDAGYAWRWMHATREFLEPWHHRVHQLEDILHRYADPRQNPGWPAWFTSNHDENSWNGTEYEKYGGMAMPLAVFSCTWPGVFLMYSGQELPNRKRLAFFDRDPIGWTDAPALHDFFKRLLQLRATHPAFSTDRALRLHGSHDSQVLCFLRETADRAILVVLNFSSYRHWDFTIRDERLSGTFTELFAERRQDFSADKSIDLDPWSYQVWHR
jgi:alpha-amylase